MFRTYTIDERTRARVGYPDGHVEVDVDLPFPLSAIKKTATRHLSIDAVLRAFPAINHAMKLAQALRQAERPK